VKLSCQVSRVFANRPVVVRVPCVRRREASSRRGTIDIDVMIANTKYVTSKRQYVLMFFQRADPAFARV